MAQIKEIGTKKNQIGESGGERKKHPGANPVSASTSPILSTIENATFARFMKKSMHLKTGFLLDYQVFVLASEWTTN